MTAGSARDGHPDAAERGLVAAVIDALLREDYASLSGRVRSRPGETALHLPADCGKPGLVLPLEPDGFLADLRIRRPAPTLAIDDLRRALAVMSDPRDREGAAALAEECRQALATLRLRDRHLPAVRARLARHAQTRPAMWLGPGGQCRYDALAAAMPHPVYPASACRLGFSDEDSLRYAPEYLPGFELRWVAVPEAALTRAGPARPPWWPAPTEVGLPASLTATHALLPVHPLTARTELGRALAASGLANTAVTAPQPHLRVIPTLSTRTVAVDGDPGCHLKLPLPTSTLGLRNRRSIAPGTLADGALIGAIVAGAASGGAQPGSLLAGSLLAADDGSYAHAGHPYLGYLLRRMPEGLERCRIVPLAALLAPGPQADCQGRPLVVEELAGQFYDGDLTRLLTAYLSLLFGTQVDLFVRYGIALEAHQQNAALVFGPPGSASPRLLVKDFDGAMINHARLAAALGAAAPGPAAFGDPRLLTGSDDALADVFITITVHLCAGALAFGLAERGAAPLPRLLALIRDALDDALGRHAGSPAAALLRARVLDAERLPGKSMLTAGTLLSKARSGARDINKFYATSGPNYLKTGIRGGGR